MQRSKNVRSYIQPDHKCTDEGERGSQALLVQKQNFLFNLRTAWPKARRSKTAKQDGIAQFSCYSAQLSKYLRYMRQQLILLSNQVKISNIHYEKFVRDAIMNLLQPFKSATEKLAAEKSPTISMLTPSVIVQGDASPSRLSVNRESMLSYLHNQKDDITYVHNGITSRSPSKRVTFFYCGEKVTVTLI